MTPSCSAVPLRRCLTPAIEGAWKDVSAQCRTFEKGCAEAAETAVPDLTLWRPDVPRGGRRRGRRARVRESRKRRATMCTGDTLAKSRQQMARRAGHCRWRKATYDNTVIPGEDGKLIEPGDKVPSSGCVAGYEDPKREGGEWVHRSAVATSIAFRVLVWALEGPGPGVSRRGGWKRLSGPRDVWTLLVGGWITVISTVSASELRARP